MAHLWKIYAATFLTLAVVYVVMPSGRSADALYAVVGTSCVVAMLLGIAVNKPSSPLPWYLLTLGQAAWVAGDLIYAADQYAAVPAVSPTWSDIPYLASYPVTACAVLLLIRAQRRSRDLAGLVDSLIVTVAIALLSWELIAAPMVEHLTTFDLAEIIAIAYPAGDIVILALLMRLMTGQGTWSPSFCLLAGATLSTIAADTGFAASPSGSGYLGALDLLWLASYVLWGAAALHPDMASLAAPAVRSSRPFTSRRLIVLGGAIMLPVVLYVVRETAGLDIDLGVLVVGAAVLSLLALARMACAIEEIRLTTQQRDDLHDDLFRRATQDEVTGLPNRPSFVRLVGLALERARRGGHRSAVVVVEVSGTGEVARRHGHFYADAVMAEIARRLEGVVDGDDCVARIGPRHFGVLIDRLDRHSLTLSARQVLGACRAPIRINGQTTSLAAHAGAATSLDGGVNPEVLLRDATLATASARESGLSDVEFFDAALRNEVTRRNSIEAGLRTALGAGQLEVYYQPLLAVGAERLNGYEALIRWNRPGHGVLSPDSFIPIAEKSDLICDLDRWVLLEATRQMAAWTRADPRCAGLSVSVNVSGRHLAGDTVVDDVLQALRVSGLEPAQLTLEITETVLVDVPRAVAQMSALRQLGVSVSIDDFGTGYTSIGQLGQLPADSIKVDRSLVISDKNGARELLALIVQAGHACGLRVVAEGIEHLEQLDTITELHYDTAQGYLIGMPQPARDEHPPGCTGADLADLRRIPRVTPRVR